MSTCAAVLHLVQEKWFVGGRQACPAREQSLLGWTLASLPVMVEETGELVPVLLEAEVWPHALR